MRKIDDGAWISENGELWIEEDGKLDSFTPTDAQPPRVKRATGFFYLDVPTYGLLGVLWRNNPLQFASEATAIEMVKVIERIIPGAKVFRYAEEVRVGPFSWREKWMLSVNYAGASVDLNAGLEASMLARSSAHYRDGLKARLA